AGDAVLRVERGADRGRGRLRVLVEEFSERGAVLPVHPGEGLVPVDLLEPEEIVVGRGSGTGLRRSFDHGPTLRTDSQPTLSTGSRHQPSAPILSGRRSSRRSSCALSATTTVDRDMRIAPTLMGRTNP